MATATVILCAQLWVKSEEDSSWIKLLLKSLYVVDSAGKGMGNWFINGSFAY